MVLDTRGVAGKAAGMRFESVPALRCKAPLPGILQPVRRALVDQTDSCYMNTRRHRKMCTRALRIVPNAGQVGNCSPILGISIRPDPPPASSCSSGSYEDVGVRLGILGIF